MKPFYVFRHFHIPAYMGEGLIRWIEHGILPGEFLQAVLRNDLMGAVHRADGTNIENLPAYIGYLYNEAPQGCFGSPEAVKAWEEKHRKAREEARLRATL